MHCKDKHYSLNHQKKYKNNAQGTSHRVTKYKKSSKITDNCRINVIFAARLSLV